MRNLFRTNWGRFFKALRSGQNPFTEPSRTEVYPPLKMRPRRVSRIRPLSTARKKTK